MGVGKRVKEIAKEKGVSLRKLSEMTGIPVNTLYSMTQRDNGIKMQNAIKIAAALGVDEGCFFGKDEVVAKPRGSSDTERKELQQQIIDELKRLKKALNQLSDAFTTNEIVNTAMLLTTEGKRNLLANAKEMVNNPQYRLEGRRTPNDL